MVPAVSVVNDKILQHNTELTSLVSRLSEEKRQLKSMLRSLEEQLESIPLAQVQTFSLDFDPFFNFRLI